MDSLLSPRKRTKNLIKFCKSSFEWTNHTHTHNSLKQTLTFIWSKRTSSILLMTLPILLLLHSCLFTVCSPQTFKMVNNNQQQYLKWKHTNFAVFRLQCYDALVLESKWRFATHHNKSSIKQNVKYKPVSQFHCSLIWPEPLIR